METGGGCRVGTAGWSYPDWKGIVYPAGAAGDRSALALLSRLVDVVEINVTYYRPIPARMCLSWLKTVAPNPSFRFTAKAPASLTHERGDKPDPSLAGAFVESLRPLADSGRLGAVLLQFPWSFRRIPDNRVYLERLVELLHPLPLCVEMRHASWDHPGFLSGLRERRVAFCNIDQPQLAECLAPSAWVTAPFAYVRLHGRNHQQWFDAGAGRNDRYNYLYDKAELAPWITRILAMKQEVNDLYVITNNHYRGQAVVNALEIQSALGMPPRAMPAALAYLYSGRPPLQGS